MDLLERRQLINEVNHMMEFRGLLEICPTDVAGRLVDCVLKVAQQ